MSNIHGMKLVTGEDIIAKCTFLAGGKTALANPAIVGMVPDQTGRPTPGLADYLPFATKKQIILLDHHILYSYEPVGPMLNAYSERFGGGLVAVKKPGLIMPMDMATPNPVAKEPDNSNVVPFTKRES